MADRRRAVFALLLTLAAAPAAADVSCTGSNVALSLGVYTVDNPAPMDSSAMFTVSCTRQGGPRNVDVTVAVGPSLHTGSVASRALKLATGADLLAYNVFRDAAMQLVWGDTAGANTAMQRMSLQNKTTDSVSFTVFGRVPPLQDVRAGLYDDQLTVTVMP